MIMRRRFFKKSSSVNIENYMTIEALEDGITVTFTHTGVLKNERCEYSINGGVWKVLLVGISSPAINKGETISFKANGFNSSGIDNVTGVVSVSGSFNLKGNVLSMCYGDNAESEDSIGDNSFARMFSESDVVSVSENFLPATTLASNCYDSMFYYCQKLTQAPKLPATTLASNCYDRMFYYCQKLNYIKMLATDISASDCLSSWVYNVSPTGTFVKSKNATWDVVGVNGVPTGWTVIDDTFPTNEDGFPESTEFSFPLYLNFPKEPSYEDEYEVEYTLVSEILGQLYDYIKEIAGFEKVVSMNDNPMYVNGYRVTSIRLGPPMLISGIDVFDSLEFTKKTLIGVKSK